MYTAMRNAAASLKTELRVYQAVRRDPRTPRAARLLLAAAIGYALLPFDLIPDFIPVIGHLDDVIIVPLLIVVARRMIPIAIFDDARLAVAEAATAR